MDRVVDGRVNGAPFAGIVLTAGSVLRADDAAGPVLSKKMEDAPLAGWYTIDGGQTPEDDIIEIKRERPPRLVLVDAADMALPIGTIRLLDKRDVARKSMFTTHSLPLSILIEEIEQSCEDIVFIGIQPGDTEFYNPMSPEVFDAVDAVYDAVAANDFSHFVRLGQELLRRLPLLNRKEVIDMADSKVEYPAPNCLAPAAIEAKTEAAGVTKANLPVSKAFVLAMFAGAFIAFGGLFFTVFLSDSTLGWGAQRVVGGLCFCLGLVLVLVCGAELFTGNSLMVCAFKSKKITLVQMLKAWVVVWVGNFVGALFIVFLVYMAGIYKLNGDAVANSMVSVAAGKVTIDWVTIFFRGILCNIFVCLAVWIGTAGETVVDKVVGILLPIAAFVACGFEHCVANMYFLPMGAVMHACGYGAEVAGADALNAAGIAFNLSAATLGNIVGGAVLVALGYWFIFAKKSEV